MNSSIKKELLVKELYEDAIRYLEDHEKISVTIGYSHIEDFKGKLSIEEMQHIIDIVDVIKIFNDEKIIKNRSYNSNKSRVLKRGYKYGSQNEIG